MWQLRLHSFHLHWFLFRTRALPRHHCSSGLTDLSPEFLMTGHWVTCIKHFPIHIQGMAGFWTRWFPSLGHLINLWLIYLHSCLKAFPTTLFRTRWPSISSASSLWKQHMWLWHSQRGEVSWLRLQEESILFSRVVSYWCSCLGRSDQVLIPPHGSSFNSYLQSSCGNRSHKSTGLV